MSIWQVINTRPLERAEPLTSALKQAGFDVVELPLLELVACPFDEVMQQQLNQIHAAKNIVVVSPTAAKLGLQYLQQLGISPRTLSAQWVAVGQGTANELKAHGLAVTIPEVETSEGMMSLDIFAADSLVEPQPHKGNLIMFWRGYGGRRFMLEQLITQGQRVIDINLYQRKLPLQSISRYNTLFEHVPDVLLVSSGQSWQHWQQLAAQHQRQPIYPKVILVLGARVYQQIVSTLISAGAISSHVVQMDDLQPSSIVKVLKQLQKCEQT